MASRGFFQLYFFYDFDSIIIIYYLKMIYDYMNKDDIVMHMRKRGELKLYW